MKKATVHDICRIINMEHIPDWDTLYMSIATITARKSKDSTQVGAVLVSSENAILGAAFNGPPAGVADLPERFERPTKYLYASHAEANLIAFAARNGVSTRGCTVYVTHYPCATCARLLIQAGIWTVVYGEGLTHMDSEEFEAASIMFDEARVVVRKLGE